MRKYLKNVKITSKKRLRLIAQVLFFHVLIFKRKKAHGLNSNWALPSDLMKTRAMINKYGDKYDFL